MNKTKVRYVVRGLALILAVAICVGLFFVVPSEAADTSDLGKLVDSFASNGSVFSLTTGSRFFIDSTATPNKEIIETVQLAQTQFAADGYPSSSVLPIVWGDSSLVLPGDIVIRADSSIAAEGYKLTVTTSAVVSFSDCDGLLYGLNMLLKHFRMADENSIKGFTCADTPDIAERTVSLDFARKYYSKDWICNFIKQMSWMGYNTLQLHLAEDSGIRMDIWDKAYYKGDFQPANDFSWICGSENAYYISLFSPNGVVQEDQHKDWFLTTAEMIEILETAKEYRIDVIPSFDSPGHMDYLNWKYEDHYLKNNDYHFYSTYYDKTYYAKDIQGIINYTNAKSANITPIRNKPYFKAVNINNEQAKAFVFELYTDIGNFFKEYAGSSDFSICADEVVLSGSLLSGYSFQFNYGDFVGYICELNAHLNGMGYTCRAYNDFIGHNSYASSYPLSKFPSNLEIMYWQSNFNSGSGSSTTCKDVYYFDGTMPVYNCISNHTYYAMAYSSSASGKHPDCRCPNNSNWTMGYGTEEIVYNNWSPLDFTARGKYNQSSQMVSAQYVSGAYFLIWSDNPMLSTEQQIWNGFYSCDNNHLYVDLMDRMWSNTIKMWNSDVNSTATFAQFTSIRDDALDDFPGLSTCSEPDILPSATEPVALISGAQLKAALGNKLSSEKYTDVSYSIYSAAYDSALAKAQGSLDTHAKQLALLTALDTYNTAKAGLALRTFQISVQPMAVINGLQVQLGNPITYTTDPDNGAYQIYLPPINGYSYLRIEGSSYYPLDSNDGAGYVSGIASSDLFITVWYAQNLNTSRLDSLIRNAIGQQGNYTTDSWNTYAAALAQAKAFTVTHTTTQADIDALISALESAQDALVVSTDVETYILVEKLNEIYPYGKQIGLRVTTSPDVTTLTVTDMNGATPAQEDLLFLSGEVQTLENGETVKIWLIMFPADISGENLIYRVSYGDTYTDVSVNVG